MDRQSVLDTREQRVAFALAHAFGAASGGGVVDRAALSLARCFFSLARIRASTGDVSWTGHSGMFVGMTRPGQSPLAGMSHHLHPNASGEKKEKRNIY